MTTIKLTDSMSAIQKKLNKGGDIIWQNGVYDITKQLVIKADTTMTLNGSRLRRCADIQSIFINDCKTSTKGYNGDGNIKITNGTLEGMGKYSPDNLFTLFHSHDVHITNITFLDTRCHALEINSSKNITVLGCKFLGCNVDEAYKEMIQIDAAYAGGFWKNGSSLKSKCYDGTMCNHIRIENCYFSKSESRDYPSACIGTHTQIINGRTHKDIKILQNTFYCGGLNKNQACLSLIGMEDVQIFSNYFRRCGRVARIYSKDFSYNLLGNKEIPMPDDGKCKGFHIIDNVAEDSQGNNKCSGIYIDNKNAQNIKITGNKFYKRSDHEKYYLYATDEVVDLIVKNNDSDLKAKI